MQPYRLAIASSSAPSCLDPPIRACEPQPRRTWRLEALAAAALTLAGVSGVWVGRQIGHRGHVEIAPTALALARHTPRAKSRERRQPARASRLTTTDHALLRGEHDPKKLTTRAKTLASLGVDVTVVDVPISNEIQSETILGNDFTQWKPVYDMENKIVALEVGGLPRSSPLHAVGLADGDRVLSVDGWDLEDDRMLDVDANAVRKRGWVVVELARGTHRVVLSIHWK